MLYANANANAVVIRNQDYTNHAFSAAFSYAFTPFLLPRLTSLRETQQQHKHSWIKKASNAAALATHMKANILVPIVAPILTSVTEFSKAFCMMMNMTVATTEAAMIQIASNAVRSMTTNAVQRLVTERKTIKIMTKEKHVPARKRPNIHFEAISRMLRMS
jgi:hypothetical protein